MKQAVALLLDSAFGIQSIELLVSHSLIANNWPSCCSSILPLLFKWNLMFYCCFFCSDPHIISDLTFAKQCLIGVRKVQEISTFPASHFTNSVLLYESLNATSFYITVHIQMSEQSLMIHVMTLQTHS